MSAFRIRNSALHTALSKKHYSRRKANAVFVERSPCLKRMAACLPVFNANVRSMLLLPSDVERRAVKISLPQKQAGNYRRSWRPGQAPLSVRSQNTFSIKKFVHLIQVRFTMDSGGGSIARFKLLPPLLHKESPRYQSDTMLCGFEHTGWNMRLSGPTTACLKTQSNTWTNSYDAKINVLLPLLPLQYICCHFGDMSLVTTEGHDSMEKRPFWEARKISASYWNRNVTVTFRWTHPESDASSLQPISAKPTVRIPQCLCSVLPSSLLWVHYV
jgi:hypothetical protein